MKKYTNIDDYLENYPDLAEAKKKSEEDGKDGEEKRKKEEEKEELERQEQERELEKKKRISKIIGEHEYPIYKSRVNMLSKLFEYLKPDFNTKVKDWKLKAEYHPSAPVPSTYIAQQGMSGGGFSLAWSRYTLTFRNKKINKIEKIWFGLGGYYIPEYDFTISKVYMKDIVKHNLRNTVSGFIKEVNIGKHIYK